MPAGFAFPDPVPQFWIPIQLGPENLRAGGFNFRGVARLRDGATLEAARAEQNGLIARYPDRFPEDGIARTLVNDGHMASNALTLKEWVIGSTERALWILLGGVGLVLLVACTNVANLFLVRTEVRQREVAVRRALGAGRTSMAGFFLSETLILVGLGGATGLGIAAVAVRVLRGFGPADLPRLHEVRIDAAVVLFTLVLSVVAALVFGLLSNVSGSENLVGSLRENGRGNTATRARMRARHLLMGGQMALALILLIASALMGRSFQRLLRVDPGFEPASALIFHIGLPQAQFHDETAVAAFHRELLARLEQLPGVRAATATTCAPLDGLCWWDPVTVVGRPAMPGDIPPITSFRTVAEEYFETLGIELMSGRAFDDSDFENGGVTVIDEQLARLYFPGEDPIGRRIGRGFSDEELTIIGVVRHVVARSLSDASPPAQMYTPLLRTSDQTFPQALSMAYIVRTSVSPISLAPTIQRVIAQMSPDVAMARIRTLDGTLREARAPAAFTATLLAIAGGVGLVLAVIGIYGVITYAVTRRTAEIGVRMALGARPRDVAAMVLRQGATVAVAGLFVGLGGALVAGRLLTSILFGVSPADPATYTVVSASLLVVAMLACWVPARRAARLDPLRALRAE
jgi:predicted permease